MNRVATPLRYAAAVLLLVGGLVHLKLYFDGYRDVPDENLGRSFLLNVVASVVVAVAVAVRREWWVRVAGIVVAGATLVAFAISRTDRGIFGLSEDGLNPSPEAIIALLAEVGAIALLVVLLVFDRAPARGEATTPRTAAALAIGTVALTVVLGVVWNARDEGTVTASGAPTTAAGEEPAVTIVDFLFSPKEVTVPAGATVTWTNNDALAHSVVADDGSFRSDALDSGATFTATFDQAGTFTYLCGIHSSMKGTVVVSG